MRVTGAVAGLVAVTPAAGFAGPMGAIVLGLVAGFVCFIACSAIKNALGYDDALDVFGVHGIGGIVGAIGTGILAAPFLGGTGVFDYTTGKVADYDMVTQVIIADQGGVPDDRLVGPRHADPARRSFAWSSACGRPPIRSAKVSISSITASGLTTTESTFAAGLALHQAPPPASSTPSSPVRAHQRPEFALRALFLQGSTRNAARRAQARAAAASRCSRRSAMQPSVGA